LLLPKFWESCVPKLWIKNARSFCWRKKSGAFKFDTSQGLNDKQSNISNTSNTNTISQNFGNNVVIISQFKKLQSSLIELLINNFEITIVIFI